MWSVSSTGGSVPPGPDIVSACPCTVLGSPSQRTGCCTVRSSATSLHATVRVTKNPTRRSPLGLTHTPTRSVCTADPTTVRAAARQNPAPANPPAKATIIVASSMKADSRSSSAEMATRQGPGR